MKRLLAKEMKLAANPLSYVFILFSFMTLIPGYPISLGAFFVALGIFYSFRNCCENNDILYTVLLPVRKSDIVRAKYWFVIVIEIAAFLLAAILTVVRITFLADADPYVTNPLLPANLTFLACFLILFALFNIVFLPGFFKTTYRIGKPFFIYCAISMLVVGLFETLPHLPGLTWLDAIGGSDLVLQLIPFAASVLFFCLGTYLSMRWSKGRFDQIDL